MAQSEVVLDSDLPESLRKHRKKPDVTDHDFITFEELQALHLCYVLSRVNGNKVTAAEILDVSLDRNL